MFIKLTAICVAFVPLIICRQESENPAQSVARAANFFGCLSASKQRAPSHRIKAVNRVLGLSLGPLKVSAELHRYFGVQKQHPFDRFPEENNAFPSIDSGAPVYEDVQEQQPSKPLQTTDALLPADDVILEESSETTQAPLKVSLKLNAPDEVTFDEGGVREGNRVRRESSTDLSEAVVDTTTDVTVDSTTIESSTIQAQESSFDSFVTLSPPPQPNQHLHVTPYPPSRNPAAQFVAITQSPHYQPHYYPPVKSFYDFHPSQPDFIPYCINWFQKTFAPIAHDTWTSDYRKWK